MRLVSGLHGTNARLTATSALDEGWRTLRVLRDIVLGRHNPCQSRRNDSCERGETPRKQGLTDDLSVAGIAAFDLGSHHTEELASQSNDVLLGIAARAKLAVDGFRQDGEGAWVASKLAVRKGKGHSRSRVFKVRAIARLSKQLRFSS